MQAQKTEITSAEEGCRENLIRARIKAETWVLTVGRCFLFRAAPPTFVFRVPALGANPCDGLHLIVTTRSVWTMPTF